MKLFIFPEKLLKVGRLQDETESRHARKGRLMSKLVVEPTATSQWQKLVKEAAITSDCKLDDELESYLVFLLMRNADRPAMADSVLALEYLQSLLNEGTQRTDQLREVGDKCLLYSGLFPERAYHKHVHIRYFIDIGQSSYQQMSETLQRGYAKMYQRLSEYFVMLMDVLQVIREMGREYCLDVLTLHELSSECGSLRAKNILSNEHNILSINFKDHPINSK